MNAYRRWRARRMMCWAVRLWREEVRSPNTTLTRQMAVWMPIHNRRQARRARRLLAEMTAIMAAMGEAFAAMAPAFVGATEAMGNLCVAWAASRVGERAVKVKRR
jgi:hypothetical protein